MGAMMTGEGHSMLEAKQDLYSAISSLLSRCREVGIKLNADKLKVNVQSIPFMRHRVASQGLKEHSIDLK